MNELSIDLETYSGTDINEGVYKYCEDPDFEILLFAYSVDKGAVICLDLKQGDIIPQEIIDALTNIWVKKKAFNANFERTCLAKHFMQRMPAEQWECTQVKSITLGLPMSLDKVGEVLNLKIQKDSLGKQLITYFSIPCKPTKANGQRNRNLPTHDLEKWKQFIGYCIRDVEVEMLIAEKLSFYKILDSEVKLWRLDQQINDRGILVDPQFVKNAIRIHDLYKARLIHEAIQLTNLQNPNSRDQLIKWLNSERGEHENTVLDVKKETVKEILKTCNNNTAKRVLTIRQETSKTSIKKYHKILEMICDDNKIRGVMQYYGANRTGRWAGRGVQVHNLPKNHLKDLDLARRLVVDNDGRLLELLFGNVPDVLSQLIRTCFIAPLNAKYVVSDFSAIEARVIAWLSGEQWRLDLFAIPRQDIYKNSVSRAFNIPIEQVTNADRQKGKVMELALGYQGGVGALLRVPGAKDKMTLEEMEALVPAWRQANKKIVQYWYDIGKAAIKCVGTREPQRIGDVVFSMLGNSMFIKLPSGRDLVYIGAHLSEGAYGPFIRYQGLNQETKQWVWLDTYGGKLVENIVQGIARDCLAFAMLNLDAAGYQIVLHVHDEIVMPVRTDHKNAVRMVNDIMCIVPPWAKGLPLAAASFENSYYKKDD